MYMLVKGHKPQRDISVCVHYERNPEISSRNEMRTDRQTSETTPARHNFKWAKIPTKKKYVAIKG